MASIVAQSVEFTNQSLISKDGTKIGYRRIGHGPGLVLVQGAMGTVENFTHLAQELASSFTVYLPERRGRGLSPKPYAADYRIQRDIEDLEVLLNITNAKYIFGLSSGGIIALQAALVLPMVEKIAVYEPALFIDGIPKKALQRFKDDITRGDMANALVTAMKAAQMGPPALSLLPNWVLAPMTNKLIKQEARMDPADRFWSGLAPTLQYDFSIVEDMSDKWHTFKEIKMKVLLLGGRKSPKYLTKALDVLERELPNTQRIEFNDLDHGAPWNYDTKQNPHGDPKRVAGQLHRFFSNN